MHKLVIFFIDKYTFATVVYADLKLQVESFTIEFSCGSTGNPLSFHPKHRVKSTECLSNLINPSSFRLDGKKLSGSERKAVPRSLTHYPGSSPSISSQTTASDSPHHRALTPPPSSQLMSKDSPTHQSDAAVTAKVSHIHTNACCR